MKVAAGHWSYFMRGGMAAAVWLLSACAGVDAPVQAPTVGMANPAAVACVKAGGAHRIARQADGSESGLCHLPNGRVCDAWAWYRGECVEGLNPPGR